MNKVNKKRMNNALAIFIFVVYIVALTEFFSIDEVIEKMEYGVSVIVLTILFFGR